MHVIHYMDSTTNKKTAVTLMKCSNTPREYDESIVVLVTHSVIFSFAIGLFAAEMTEASSDLL